MFANLFVVRCTMEYRAMYKNVLSGDEAMPWSFKLTSGVTQLLGLLLVLIGPVLMFR